jgi:radical SAM protein with 4Fe4S-binding SPASM domain
MSNVLKKHVGALPVPIMPPLPEIYQLEVTSACNFKCPMCPAQFFKRADKRLYLEISLVDKMIRQGDFDASYFVEFQLSGEPLLHPDLCNIIKKVKETNVLTGLSTNGVFIPDQMDALMELDIITVSIDSIEDHGTLREAKAGFSPIKKLINNIKALLIRAKDKGIAVDLQILEIGNWQKSVQQIKEEFDGFQCNIRTQPNCYIAFMQDDIPLPVSKDICINPWFSASIMCNGNVGPCCNSQGDDVIYGNLEHQTLREVWAGEPLKLFREEMQTGNYRDVCAKCYMRSPSLFHFNMYQSEMKNRYINHKSV